MGSVSQTAYWWIWLIVAVIAAVVESVIFGAITRAINRAKNRDGGFWWGFFLGVIGIIVVAVRPSVAIDVPRKKTVVTKDGKKVAVNNEHLVFKNYDNLYKVSGNSVAIKRCPKCGKNVIAMDTYCDFCGTKLR